MGGSHRRQRAADARRGGDRHGSIRKRPCGPSGWARAKVSVDKRTSVLQQRISELEQTISAAEAGKTSAHQRMCELEQTVGSLTTAGECNMKELNLVRAQLKVCAAELAAEREDNRVLRARLQSAHDAARLRDPLHGPPRKA